MEVKSLMAEFWASQKEQEERRALEKKQKLAMQEAGFAVRKPMKPKEVIRYARSFGFDVGPGGNHGVHLVAPNGSECPLPFHGGGKTLTIGTQGSIVAFIHQNGLPVTAGGGLSGR